MSVEYTLRFPFELSPGRQILGINQSVEHKIGTLTFSWEQQDHLYILKVSGFASELDAREYASQIWSGFMWVMLNRNIAFSINMDFDKVTYAANPQQAAENLSKTFGVPFEGKVDGLANGNLPTVYQSDKVIRFVYSGSANAILGKPVEQIFDVLVEGISLANNTGGISDAKLRTALDLYGAYYYERSANARLLTLVMALETLTVSALKSQYILDLIADWQKDVSRLKQDLGAESDEYEQLTALERELLFRKEKSLRSQARALVFDTVQMSGALNAKELADRAVKVYDKRSILVHEGALSVEDLRWAETEAKNVVEAVLRAKFVQAGNVERT